jgi:hypothetical protein
LRYKGKIAATELLSMCAVLRATRSLVLLTAIACAGIPAATAWAAQGRHDEEHDKGNGGRGKGHHGREDRYERPHESKFFRPSDRTVILNYYGGPRRLPPGLARRLERGGSLPPGWERRFRPMPVVLVRELPPPCPTCSMGIIDNCAVVYDRRTRIILDVMALVGDIAH